MDQNQEIPRSPQEKTGESPSASTSHVEAEEPSEANVSQSEAEPPAEAEAEGVIKQVKTPSKKTIVIIASVLLLAISAAAAIVGVIIPAQKTAAYDQAVIALESGDFSTAQAQLEKAGDADGTDDLRKRIANAVTLDQIIKASLQKDVANIPWGSLSEDLDKIHAICPNYPNYDNLKSYAEAGANKNLYTSYKSLLALGDFEKAQEAANLRLQQIEKCLVDAQNDAENNRWDSAKTKLNSIEGYGPATELSTQVNDILAQRKLCKDLGGKVWCNYCASDYFRISLYFAEEDGSGTIIFQASNTSFTVSDFSWRPVSGNEIEIIAASTYNRDTAGVRCDVENFNTKVTFSKQTITDQNLTGSFGSTQANTISFDPSFVDGVRNGKWVENSAIEENLETALSNARKLK